VSASATYTTAVARMIFYTHRSSDPTTTLGGSRPRHSRPRSTRRRSVRWRVWLRHDFDRAAQAGIPADHGLPAGTINSAWPTRETGRKPHRLRNHPGPGRTNLDRIDRGRALRDHPLGPLLRQSSPNLVSNNFRIAATASAASGPLPIIVICAPSPASSAISSIALRASTVWPPYSMRN
jgi:hypothetical protein